MPYYGTHSHHGTRLCCIHAHVVQRSEMVAGYSKNMKHVNIRRPLHLVYEMFLGRRVGNSDVESESDSESDDDSSDKENRMSTSSRTSAPSSASSHYLPAEEVTRKVKETINLGIFYLTLTIYLHTECSKLIFYTFKWL